MRFITFHSCEVAFAMATIEAQSSSERHQEIARAHQGLVKHTPAKSAGLLLLTNR
jgi:hypothetical protein